jgi:hypothetical protein
LNEEKAEINDELVCTVVVKLLTVGNYMKNKYHEDYYDVGCDIV